MALNVGALVGLLIFYLLILVVGLFAARYKTRQVKAKQKQDGEVQGETEVIITAGRSLGLVVGAFTMTATWVGGGFINGTAEAVYDRGLAWCQAPFGYSLSLIIGGLLFAKPMRTGNYSTMLDPLQNKHGRTIGALLAIPAFLGELFWTAAILRALGSTLSFIIDLDLNACIIISTLIAIAYTMAGGLFSVAYTDIVQLVLIALGLIICVPFAWNNENVYINREVTNSSVRIAAQERDWVGSVESDAIAKYIDDFLLLILGGIPWQVYFQRVLSTQTATYAQLLSFTAAIGCLLLSIPPILVGVIARHTDWAAAGYDLPSDVTATLPAVLAHLTPIGAAFFGLSAVAAAVMSSVDSSILSSASMFVHNIYLKLCHAMNYNPPEIITIWVLRVVIFICGAVGCILAILVDSVYGLWYISSDLVYVILFPQLLLVLYVRFTNAYGVTVGCTVAAIIRLIGGAPDIGVPRSVVYTTLDRNGYQLFPFKTLAMLLNLLLTLLISYLTAKLHSMGYFETKYDVLKAFRKRRYHDKLNPPSQQRTSSIVSSSGRANPGFELTEIELHDDDVVKNGPVKKHISWATDQVQVCEFSSDPVDKSDSESDASDDSDARMRAAAQRAMTRRHSAHPALFRLEADAVKAKHPRRRFSVMPEEDDDSVAESPKLDMKKLQARRHTLAVVAEGGGRRSGNVSD